MGLLCQLSKGRAWLLLRNRLLDLVFQQSLRRAILFVEQAVSSVGWFYREPCRMV